MKAKPPASFRKLTYAQMQEIDVLIRAHADVEGGFVRYAPGWGDLQVSAEVPEAIWDDYMGDRIDAVATFRSRNIGSIRVPAAPKVRATKPPALPAPTTLEGRLADLEYRVRVLETPVQGGLDV